MDPDTAESESGQVVDEEFYLIIEPDPVLSEDDWMPGEFDIQ